MSIQGISGGSAPIFGKETFGAAVVGKTLDYLNGQASPTAQPFDKETFGAAVVTKTLDYMNENKHRYQDQSTYSFQKDVLMPVYTGRGTLLDSLV